MKRRMFVARCCCDDQPGEVISESWGALWEREYLAPTGVTDIHPAGGTMEVGYWVQPPPSTIERRESGYGIFEFSGSSVSSFDVELQFPPSTVTRNIDMICGIGEVAAGVGAAFYSATWTPEGAETTFTVNGVSSHTENIDFTSQLSAILSGNTGTKNVYIWVRENPQQSADPTLAPAIDDESRQCNPFTTFVA